MTKQEAYELIDAYEADPSGFKACDNPCTVAEALGLEEGEYQVDVLREMVTEQLGDEETYVYAVCTDASMQDVAAADIDEAAKLFAEGEFPGVEIANVADLFAHIGTIGDGAWCWIESRDAPDGERQQVGGWAAEY